ncbi:hypothetical protein V1264_019171 [Littorina saxatilis]|uniref:MOSC domain-containing protein n=3 Tax=Littorina saxatilis TaxID=31220 RepID=A0AAN9BGQ3_9CAEN
MSEIPQEAVIFATLVGGAVVKMLFGAVTRKNRRRKMVKVGTVSELNCYPIKSCRGISVQEGMCTRLGLKVGKAADRHWMVVRSNGDFVTQRQFSRMALIQTAIEGNELIVDAPDMPTLKLPLNPITDRWHVMICRVWDLRTEGMDCGDDAAYWFSTFLKVEGVRMVYSAPDIDHRDLTKVPKPMGNFTVPGDQAAFSDFSAYFVLTEESLAALNENLAEKVTMERFRPNIVITGSPAAFDEDDWGEVEIEESAILRMLDRGSRCVITTINPDTGEKDPNSQPLETLKAMRCFPEYGSSPLFGVNATVETEGKVRVGDAVYAFMK